MSEGKLAHDWEQTSFVVWMIYSRHRQKSEAEKKPQDFNPLRHQPQVLDRHSISAFKEGDKGAKNTDSTSSEYPSSVASRKSRRKTSRDEGGRLRPDEPEPRPVGDQE